jgi:penicillin-binding protein 1A
MRAQPKTVCHDCKSADFAEDTSALPVSIDDSTLMLLEADEVNADSVISPQNAWIINSMMRDVIRRGTGRRAREVGRDDLAGKTGTTNDQRDAWFSGFNTELVATAWVGFDQFQPLGDRETGAHAALPMWVKFMRSALKDISSSPLERPTGLVAVRIDPDTGELASADNSRAIFEIFRSDYVPEGPASNQMPTTHSDELGVEEIPEQLF